MTTDLNEAYIKRLHENFCLVKQVFLVREIDNLLAARRDSPPISRVFHKDLREGAVQPTPGGSNKAKLKEEAFLVRGRVQGGGIPGDNPAGHCFVLSNLIPFQ